MRRFCAVALLFTFAPTLIAAPYDEMDYGPFLSHTFQLPNNNVTLRGIAVPFDAPIDGESITPGAKGKPANNPAKCGIIFDTELLRYSGYWNGGFVTWNGVVFNGSHGGNPGPAGKILAVTKQVPGWAKDGKFEDPRPIPHGPLPRDWGRYKGLYRSDKGVIFSYTVGDTHVLDMPTVEVRGKHRVFVRTLNLSPSKMERRLNIADLTKVKAMTNVGSMMMIDDDQNVVVANIIGGPKGTELVPGVGITAKIPASAGPVQLCVAVWGGPKADWEAGAKALDQLAKPFDLAPFIKGGKARFTETVTTKGKRGDDNTAYAVDSITPPLKNPYKSWMRFGGFDFFSDGRAAVCTWSGDVWIVSGIDDKLEKLTWKRFATGLFQALGLKIVDDKIYVLGRDQITRLHDLNGDGEADFYECFNNDALITTNFHEFAFDLQTDPEGNFYFIKGGPVRPGRPRLGQDHAAPRLHLQGLQGRLQARSRRPRLPRAQRHGRRPQRRNHQRRQRRHLDPDLPHQLDQARRLLRRPRFRRQTQGRLPQGPRQSALLAAARRRRQLQRRPGLGHQQQLRPASRPTAAHLLRQVSALYSS